jgi:D-arabinitol dehydrogenase (NADP+)
LEVLVRAVVFSRPHEFGVVDVADPVPGAGEVRLRPVLTGVCGTDLHLLAGGFLARYPLIPGHEIVGAVESLGDGVTGLAAGDLVAADNTVLCGWCDYCRRGTPLYCRNFHSLGVTGPGGFAEYVVVRAEKCFRLDGLDPLVAVLTEPLACAVHGADVLALRPGSDVLVFGAGPTGLLLAQLLLHGGAARLTVAAPTERKLELARSYGVDQTVHIGRDGVGDGPRRLRTLAPDGFDVVVEATGSPAVLAQCPALTRTGGTVLVYGMAAAEDRVPFAPYEIFARELTIKGSFAQTHCFDRALLALRTGRIRTEGIVSDQFPLDRFDQALAAVASPASVKAVVTV